MGAPPAHALDDLLVWHVDLQHGIEAHAGRLQGVSLREGAGKAVEEEPARAVGLGDALLDEADDEVVAHQAPGVHDLLGGQTQRRAGLDCGAQHVARGDLRNAEALAEVGGLRALAGSWGAQKNESHRSLLPAIVGFVRRFRRLSPAGSTRGSQPDR